MKDEKWKLTHRVTWRFIPFFLLSCVVTAPAFAQTKCWIEFRDKGIRSEDFRPGLPIFEHVRSSLSPACLARRSLALHCSPDETITLADAPVAQSYLHSILQLGIRIQNLSKWCNAGSAVLSREQCKQLSKLSFVKSVIPVRVSKTLSVQPIPHSSKSGEHSTSLLSRISHDRPLSNNCGYDPIVNEYGFAESQLSRINVWPLHAMGFDGSGVLLGFLDAGFRWRETPSLQSTHVISEYDYIFHDSITENQSEDTSTQDGHGTATLSIAVGNSPDTLVGPAYHATLLLAKTEDVRSEHHIEEDNYAAALEDMEARGVEITSSSLGYFTFDPPDISYSYADMNGHTSIVARAVERAAKLGVLVVTAMGNSGTTSEPHLDSPADADSILGAGALDVDDTIADFSSRGPTSDGRIKPEICAPGVADWFQGRDGPFGSGNGTSFATPLISGACCLIKQAHPEATAQEIRRAVMLTGNNAAHPDTAYGWGKLNAYAAALELGIIAHIKNVWVDSTVHVCVGCASKFGIASATIEYDTTGDGSFISLPLSLAADSLIYNGDLPMISRGTLIRYRLLAVDSSGKSAFAPAIGWDSIVVAPFPEGSLMVTVAPSPAADHFTLDANETGDWRIFDPAGRLMMSGSVQSVYTHVNIPVRLLANGPYYLEFISHSGDTKTLAIVVAH
jgi:serine protease AprX